MKCCGVRVKAKPIPADSNLILWFTACPVCKKTSGGHYTAQESEETFEKLFLLHDEHFQELRRYNMRRNLNTLNARTRFISV